jgi:hypothetical protein
MAVSLNHTTLQILEELKFDDRGSPWTWCFQHDTRGRFSTSWIFEGGLALNLQWDVESQWPDLDGATCNANAQGSVKQPLARSLMPSVRTLRLLTLTVFPWPLRITGHGLFILMFVPIYWCLYPYIYNIQYIYIILYIYMYLKFRIILPCPI